MLPLDTRALRSVAVVGLNADRCLYGHYSGSPVNEPVSLLQGLLNRTPTSLAVQHVKWRYREPGQFYLCGDDFLAGDGQSEAMGFLGEYFTNPRLEGPPAHSRVDAAIHYNWQWWVDPFVDPDEPFSIRWTATFAPRVSGTYVFKHQFTSGFRLYVDDALVDELWRDVIDGSDRKPTSLKFQAGRRYRIRVEFYAVSRDRTGVCLEWCAPSEPDVNAFGPEIDAARKCDVVIAALGLDLTYECEGKDRCTLGLSEEQTAMVRAVAAVNPKIVLVLQSGSPLAIPAMASYAPAILEAWYPGEQGGNAMADVLFGTCNPAGRLPVTFYDSDDQLPDLHDYDITHGRTYMYLAETPLYPFGHGLSYTSYEYANLRIDPATAGLTPAVTVRVFVDVRNSGDRDGEEVVQLYVRAPESVRPRPLRQLKGFRRVGLASGEQQTVEFALPVRELAFYREERAAFAVETGDYLIEIGASSGDIRVRGQLAVRESP